MKLRATCLLHLRLSWRTAERKRCMLPARLVRTYIVLRLREDVYSRLLDDLCSRTANSHGELAELRAWCTNDNGSQRWSYTDTKEVNRGMTHIWLKSVDLGLEGRGMTGDRGPFMHILNNIEIVPP